MTVSTTNSRDLATGNGTVGPFTFTFTLQQATDMNVYVAGSLISAGLYTITPTGGAYPCVGGSISWNLLVNAPASGVALVFTSAIAYTQALSLPVETDFPEKSLENALDKLTLQVQQLKQLVDLSLHFNVTESINPLLSGQKALYLPRINAANTGFEFASAAQIANEVTAGNGNIVGPATSTARTVMLWNNATGTLAKAGPAIGTSGQVLTSQGAGADPIFAAASGGIGVFKCRLSLESGVKISTTDQLAKSTLYVIGGYIPLFESSVTVQKKINSGQISVSIVGTSGLPYDVFAYDSDAGGDVDTPALVAWTNGTTRATALTYIVDGDYWVHSGNNRTYLGTILLSATNQCEDSIKHRGIWSYSNRTLRSLYCFDTTDSWSYNSVTYRAFNASAVLGTGNVKCIIGLSEDAAQFNVQGSGNSSNGDPNLVVGIGIDSTTTSSAQVFQPVSGGSTANFPLSATAGYNGILAIGAHTISPIEKCTTASSVTIYGDNAGRQQSGLTGLVFC